MDLIDREKALGCFWNYANDDGTGYDETDMPAYDRLQALPIVAEVEDCISRQAAIDKLLQLVQDRYAWQKDASEQVRGINVAICAIKELPSAQPEIIRCRECKHYDGRPCGIVDYYNSADDFCSRTERRQDEQIC